MRLSPLFAAARAGIGSLQEDNARQRKEAAAREEALRQRTLEDVLNQQRAEQHMAQMASRTLDDELKRVTIDAARTPTPKAPVRGTPEYINAIKDEERARASVTTPKPPSEPRMSDTGTLRGQFNSEQTAKDAAQVATSYRKIKHAATNPSAAGDLSLIFGYMRMLDPASTVREGEQASAQNAAGVPDQVRNIYNRALRGERLNPNQRADFLAQAEGIANAQRQSLRGVIGRYSDIATRNKLNPKDIVYDPFDEETTQTVEGLSASDLAKAKADPEFAAWLRARGVKVP